MKKILLLLFSFLSLYSFAQENYRSPLDVKLLLSANFAELRPNHFHSGIDIKTEGVVNKPVYSIDDGYVSRISVSPSGYGLAIYVNHPDGKTSVYGHCNRYAPAIASFVTNKQYEAESFAVDLNLDQNTFPVKKGDLIAYSGNTGSSFGPHVHFEIRDTDTQRALDPLAYYKSQIKDTEVPIIKAIAIYPISGKGVVNNSEKVFRETLTLQKNGGYSKPKTPIKAWGQIGVGISAIDKMSDTHNLFGVKIVKMYCDNKLIFESNIDGFLFEQTRMINSLTDFDYWYRHKMFFMKSFVEPGNKLSIYKTENNGYLNIDTEKIYNIKYDLIDLYGNKTQYSFSIEGVKTNIPSAQPCSQVMAWNQNNYFMTDDFSLNIPKGYLYDDIGFILGRSKSNTFYSDIYTVHDAFTPLDGYSPMKIKLNKDSLVDKSKYGIISLNAKGRQSWIGGSYENGYMTTSIRELGHRYAVSTDNTAPLITPLQPEKWVAQRKISIKVSDNESGLAQCRGMVDGKYVLFEKDMKAPAYTYTFDDTRLTKGQKHKLFFEARDRVGNISTYEYEFTY